MEIILFILHVSRTHFMGVVLVILSVIHRYQNKSKYN